MPKAPVSTRESDRVESELRRLILTLELEPGSAVSEAALMQRYGWGRTPLREAFQRLAEQSLVQIMPRQGVIITALSVFDFVEMMDAIAIVISSAASLACKRLTEAEFVQLEEIVAQGEAAEGGRDFAKISDLDYQFHRALALATGNRYLSRYLLHLHQMATRFNFAAWKRDGSASQSLSEHRCILDALRKRDPVEARSVMLAHIEAGRQRVMGAINVE